MLYGMIWRRSYATHVYSLCAGYAPGWKERAQVKKRLRRRLEERKKRHLKTLKYELEYEKKDDDGNLYETQRKKMTGHDNMSHLSIWA